MPFNRRCQTITFLLTSHTAHHICLRNLNKIIHSGGALVSPQVLRITSEGGIYSSWCVTLKQAFVVFVRLTTVQLGHVLYRVHSYFFLRESAFWKRELVGSSTAPDAPLLQGNGSTNAIILEEDPKDFDCFLWVFYNENLGDFSAKLQDWITIMRYATRWDFPRIKDLAIQQLEKHEMNPIDRIKLYQENKLPEKYLFPLYVCLASRQELLGIEESRTLGIETLVLIQQARERLRAPTSPMGDKFLSPIRTDLKPADVFDIVSATFNISFGELPADPKPGTPVFCPFFW
ncbi:hypothetical protein AGABI1DRAFT_39745 [Agaricus bisporus var. burnettii JB137-S8]|uniref:BTB domain-containing protein n=1 Tax=Agaricus bisporus var. burnettii (strain JB137-S8 / ATCC MYA-4627 / FGSC 10392) TaxID=597362 RepID=K5WW62_AGABU|nr:uncharacterized protein AGABI1DRAFT_39745 [Agaricus bisporus var. burnettii JB137-S8]EKM79701.1 hypothetical protein AGABI1DRAFT_39745 [Agaricus bisporus var. burnettii JB137-S8]